MPIDTAILPAPSRARGLAGERLFFTLLAASMFLSVLIGFAPTYYVGPLVGPAPVMARASLLVHLHGSIFSVWVLLFMVQVGLVAANRRDLHMALGTGGIVLVPLMVVVGALTALHQVGRRSGPPLDPLSWLAVPLLSVVGFGVLFLAALALRRTPGAHKRLMVLGMAAMISAAFGRMPFIPTMLGILVLPNLYTVALLIWDVATTRRPHAASLLGGLLVLATTVGPIFIWRTPAWKAFAAWAVALVT
jgi:hypothetical protein